MRLTLDFFLVDDLATLYCEVRLQLTVVRRKKKGGKDFFEAKRA